MVKNLTNTTVLTATDKVYCSSRVLVDILAAKCLCILKGVLAVLAYVIGRGDFLACNDCVFCGEYLVDSGLTLPVAEPPLEGFSSHLCPLLRGEVRVFAVGGFKISAVSLRLGYYVHFLFCEEPFLETLYTCGAMNGIGELFRIGGVRNDYHHRWPAYCIEGRHCGGAGIEDIIHEYRHLPIGKFFRKVKIHRTE